eukprot:jgi/Chlat1/3618/Chrsp237S03618
MSEADDMAAVTAASSGVADPFCINCWSGPRCLSTSLMYSFAQRTDTAVLDEPLYANFLVQTGAERPYRQAVLDSQDSDGPRVVDTLLLGPRKTKVLYAKHMGKQRTPNLGKDLLTQARHVILIRDPIHLLPSFAEVLPCTLEETCLPALVQLYSELRQQGRPPPVVDANVLRQNPEGTLRALCAALGLEFQSQMLHWKAGPRPVDGVWAKWWYDGVHTHSGFDSSSTLPKPFPSELYDLLEECKPFYESLRRHAIQPTESRLPLPVPRNEKILVWVHDRLVPREDAKVSVFDSVVQGGDAVWEGLRVYGGRVFQLEAHLDRLRDSAKALAFEGVPEREDIKEAVFATLVANGMLDNSHIRLTLTRGKKVTSGMSPLFNRSGPTLLVLAEWKPPVYDNAGGIRLITSSIESNHAGADDAVMLDLSGYVAETNATNLLLVKNNALIAPIPDHCLPGITRRTALRIAREDLRLHEVVERRVTPSELYTADEVFVTGTMGELTPVVEIDGRTIGDGKVGEVTTKLQHAYARWVKTKAELSVAIPKQ